MTNALGTAFPASQNGPMHANRILLPMLIVASLAADLALVTTLAERNTEWPDLLAAVSLGLAAGQINLGTLWSVLGYRHLPWRVAVLLVVPLGWSFGIAASAPEILPAYNRVATWGVHFLTHTALLASILILARMAGARLLLGALAPNERKRRQFTLRYLFAWLTATAIIMSALRSTFENAEGVQADISWLEITVLAFVNTTLGLTCVWLICDTRRYSSRLVATFVTAFPAACIVGWVVIEAGSAIFALPLLWLVAGLYSAIAFGVLRIAGYRLIWVPGRKGIPQSTPAD